MKKLSVATIVVTAFMALGIASGEQRVEAASFSFTKVVDTNTNIPGSTENFGSLSTPSLDNGITAFVGNRGVYDITPFTEGVYTTNLDGELKVVADSNTPIPGDTGNFAFLNNPSLDNTRVAFRGFGVTAAPNGGIRFIPEGIYTNIGGSVNVVADSNTLIPGGTENFGSFGIYPSLSDQGVAFVGSKNNFTQGIYTNIGGELNVIADRNTSIPNGTGNFNDFDVSFSGILTLDNGSVAFIGSGNGFQRGIYTTLGGSLSVIADRNTSVPDSKENFSSFNYPSLNNGSVAFVGSGNNFQRGVYTTLGGSLNVVADRNTPIPGGTGNFNSFGFVSLNDGYIAFIGSPITNFVPTALYTTLGGSLTKVIESNDSLEGKTVRFVAFGSEGLSGNQIAFGATFTDGSEGIYIATINPTSIPESPMVLGVLSVGAIGVGSALKRRQQT